MQQYFLRAGFTALALVLAASAQKPGGISGRVVDDDGAPVANARISAVNAVNNGETHSDAAGAFHLALPSPGKYFVTVEREGYFVLKDRPLETGDEVTLVLNPQREVFQSVAVGEPPSAVDPAQTDHEQRLSGTEINNVPYPSTQSLRNSMRLIPGVVQDPTGAVHFHGGAEYQTRYLLDGFDITDPISGRYTTLLAVEGVRSMDLASGRESAQFGRGSAGTLAINPDNGTDQFHFTATNFVPGLDTRGGGIHIGHVTPRAGFSGPIIKGRAWFSDSFNGGYNPGYISGLPKGKDSNTSWIAGNLFHAQVNLTTANILYGDFLSDFQHQDHFGLGALDPIQTTTTQRFSEWLTAVKDSHSWSNGSLLEAGIARQSVFYRGVPKGGEPYLITPDGRSGNYFVDSRQHGHRDQFFTNFFARPVRFAGKHQLLIGADAQRLDYNGLYHRTAYEMIGLNGLPLSRTAFTGSGTFDRPNTALASYINDHWQPTERLTVDIGLREDWEELVRQVALAPRVGAAYSLFADGRTKLTAGFGIIHDATNLAVFSRPLDQQPLTTRFTDTGDAQPPVLTTFLAGRELKMPRYANTSLGAEHDFGHRLSARAEWLRKRGRDGFLYAPIAGTGSVIQPQNLGYAFGGDYALSNLRRDTYDEEALTVRQSFGDQYEWMASYVHSRARSNAVLDFSVDQPLQALNNFGPMPWDSPNRILSWAYLPVPWMDGKWAVAYLVDWRTGFPYSFVTDSGVVAGSVDAHRFPSNFDLNLHLERRFVFRGRRFAIRAGANNLTAHRNPTAVDNVIGAPRFEQFYGDEGRHFEFRIRFFGKK